MRREVDGVSLEVKVGVGKTMNPVPSKWFVLSFRTFLFSSTRKNNESKIIHVKNRLDSVED